MPLRRRRVLAASLAGVSGLTLPALLQAIAAGALPPTPVRHRL
jgi:hypothetical protein